MHFDAYKKLCNNWRALVLTAIGGKVTAAPIAKSALKIERYCAGSLDPAYIHGQKYDALLLFLFPTVSSTVNNGVCFSTLTSRADCRISNEC